MTTIMVASFSAATKIKDSDFDSNLMLSLSIFAGMFSGYDKKHHTLKSAVLVLPFNALDSLHQKRLPGMNRGRSLCPASR